MEILVFAALKNTFFGIFISHPYSKINTDSWWYSGTLPYVPLEIEFWNMAVIHQLAYLLISTKCSNTLISPPRENPSEEFSSDASESPTHDLPTLTVSDLMVNMQNQKALLGSKVKLCIFNSYFFQTSNANGTHRVNIWMPFLIKPASIFLVFCASLIK